MKELVMKIKCFNLKYTLECGQCFRWNKIEDNCYIGVIKDRVVKIKQIEDTLYINSSNMEELEKVVLNYFDLNLDYSIIEDRISKVDKYINIAVKNTTGLRNLNQDFFEMIVSYIISANNNISRISKSVNEISRRYGKEIIFDEKSYYLFPTPEELKNVDIKDYRDCGVGFRDKYIFDLINKITNGEFVLNDVSKLNTNELKEKLLNLKGVGPKVADCILLFSCEKRNVFPIDVWVERIMKKLYFENEEITKKYILDYANKKFGNDSGIIQQHLFYNIREGKL